MVLQGPLAQDNIEIDRLLIGSVLKASEFHKKHHVDSNGLKPWVPLALWSQRVYSSPLFPLPY